MFTVKVDARLLGLSQSVTRAHTTFGGFRARARIGARTKRMCRHIEKRTEPSRIVPICFRHSIMYVQRT